MPGRLREGARGASTRGTGAEQFARVRLAGRPEHGADRPVFDGTPVPHDEHLVDALGGHAHVVRDEQQPHAGLLAQRVQQVEDLGLDGHVERGRRLVGDQQVRLAGQRHGDEGALPHAAAELVRTGPGSPYARPECPPGPAPRRHARVPLVATHACARGTPRRSGRRSRSTGPGTTAGPGRPSRPSRRAAAAGPSSDACCTSMPATSTEPPTPRARAAVQPEQGRGDRGLAGAGLADQGQGAALLQAEGEAVDGAQRSDRTRRYRSVTWTDELMRAPPVGRPPRTARPRRRWRGPRRSR